MNDTKFGRIILSEREMKEIDWIVKLISSLLSPIISPNSKRKNKEDNTIQNGERNSPLNSAKGDCIHQQNKAYKQGNVFVKPSTKIGNSIQSGITLRTHITPLILMFKRSITKVKSGEQPNANKTDMN